MNYSSVFDAAFNAVVGVEGKFSNDPNDSGNYTPDGVLKGTMFGISARSYPELDIANLTLDQAKQIYYTDYWSKFQADQLPSLLAICVFDGVVNQGTGGDIDLLQTIVGTVADGDFGPHSLEKTLEYINTNTVEELTAEFMRARVQKYYSLNNTEDIKGWINRTFKIVIIAARFS